jgi:hypothetical protein
MKIYVSYLQKYECKENKKPENSKFIHETMLIVVLANKESVFLSLN